MLGLNVSSFADPTIYAELQKQLFKNTQPYPQKKNEILD